MKNAIITFAIIAMIIGGLFYIAGANEEMTSEELTQFFIEFIFTATPETEDQIYSNSGYSAGTHVLDNLTEITTHKIIEVLYANQVIGMSSMIASEYNSNVTVEDFKIVNTQESDNKTYLDSEATFK